MLTTFFPKKANKVHFYKIFIILSYTCHEGLIDNISYLNLFVGLILLIILAAYSFSESI